MIPVSMSRKTRSFGQLIAYMDSEKSDEAYDLHHNCFARGQKDIEQEFYENSLHLKRRKNGNILYHEIVSISLEDGVELKYAKDSLREIALKYIQARCPNNVVYGSLHEDHADHLHYHLMISANQLGDERPHSLRKHEYERVKFDLESHVLKNYPELKQRAINTLGGTAKSESRKASAQKRRTGKLDRKEQVKASILEAMTHTTSLEEFRAKLSAQGFEFYTRGKNFGVKDLAAEKMPDKFRFSTLGIHETYEEFISVMHSLSEAQEKPKIENPTQDPQEEPSPSQGGSESFTQSKEAPAEQEALQPQDESHNQERHDFLRELEERDKRRNEKKREQAHKQHQRKGKPKSR